MKLYRMCELDQPRSSWAAHEITKKLRGRRSGEMPEAFYRFWTPPDAEVQLMDQYLPLQCPECGLYDSDEVFRTGFEGEPTIRFKQELGFTSDAVFVISERVRQVLEAAEVRGYETRPLGRSSWHALNVSLRVDTAEGMFAEGEETCPRCGRGYRENCSVWAENQISLPDATCTFFTTRGSTMAAPSSPDREIFMTADVVDVLLAAKAPGPHLERLQTDEEIRIREQKASQGRNWLPEKMTVYLRGK